VLALERTPTSTLICSLIRADDDPRWLVHCLGGY
jgi:hypothetical protein